MKDEAESSMHLIDQHPILANFLLLLSVVSLSCLSVFLLSDILSSGDASHKGLFDDVTILLGSKAVGDSSNSASSSISAAKNGSPLIKASFSNDTNNQSTRQNAVNLWNSSLSTHTAPAGNITKISSCVGRYVIPLSLGDDSSSGDSSPPKKSVAASRKNASLLNHSKPISTSVINPKTNKSETKDLKIDELQLDDLGDKRVNGSSNNIKDKAQISPARFTLSYILSDNSSAYVSYPEKISSNLTATYHVDNSAVRTLKFGTVGKGNRKDSSKVTAREPKITSQSEVKSKPKHKKTISLRQNRAVRNPKSLVPHTRPKTAKKVADRR
jgi:hypothetical protein